MKEPTDNTPALGECHAFIFDMDGTLTVPQHDFDAIRETLDIPPGELILEHIAALPAALRKKKRDRLNAIEADIAAASEPAPFVFALLDALQQRAIGIALLTRNSATNAWISLNAIGAAHYFNEHTVIGRDEALPKPDPAGIALLASRLGCEPRNCAMVGDYRHDLEAGTAAGSHTVHVHHPDTPLWPQMTQTKIRTLEELLHHL